MICTALKDRVGGAELENKRRLGLMIVMNDMKLQCDCVNVKF
jgi:hypothetical protein